MSAFSKIQKREKIHSESSDASNIKLNSRIVMPGITLFALLLLDGFTNVFTQTSGETFTVTKEFEAKSSNVVGGDYPSPVMTYKENIYFVWVDTQLRTMIGKITSDGKLTTNVIFQQTDNDAWHNGASVGIDKNGYIHVAGNMHHSPYNHPNNGNPYYQHAWQYLVSDKPEDISSFKFQGSDANRTIPGTWITYPFFARDKNGVLYVSFRHRVKFGTGWTPGIIGGGVARYDADTKRWIMLGGTNYKHGVKTFNWDPSGAQGTAYQPYRPTIFIDKNNRIHITWVTDDGTGEVGSHTHILYAYSDDGGNTFHRANGSRYDSLPITIANGDAVSAPPFTKNNNGVVYKCYVGATGDGRPIVSFYTNNRMSWWSFWIPNSGWSKPTTFPAAGYAQFLIDRNGVITTVDANKLHRSYDNGKTWKTYNNIETGGTHSFNLDYLFLDTTNQLRFRTYSSGSKWLKLWTIKFSGSDGSPDTQSPNPPKNVRVLE